MKNINIFKQLFNWVQRGPVDFCYVTGEWSFQENGTVKAALPGNAFQSANNHRSSEATRTPVVAVATARVGTPAAAPVPETPAAHDPNSRAA
jgi:hypothetical protein